MGNTNAETVHPLQPTDRDLQILRFVKSNGAKTSSDLAKRFWNEKSRKAHAGFQRIRKLIQTAFLERGNPKLLYLSERGKQLLIERQQPQRVEEVKPSA